MSRFVKEINDSPLAAERAEKDILGNKIDTTYQHKLTAGSNISINEVTNTISAQVPPDFSTVIPSDASSSNKLVSTNTLDARLADFGGFKEVPGTGSDLHPNVPSGEEDSKLIYLVMDSSATGDDKYKEWIWDSGDPEANPPVSAQWKLIGDTTMHLDGKADKVSGATNNNFAGLDANGNLKDSGKNAADFATASQGTKADSAVQPGDLGTAAYKDVPASGNASSSQVVMGNDSRLAKNIRAINVDTSEYLCIRIKKGQNHRNASGTLFCGNDEYPAIVNIGFVYLTSPGKDEAAGFKSSPRYHMVEVNNATSANYVPNVSYKYDSSTGDGYIYCKWSSLKRLTVLINTYAPGDIVLSTLTSLPTGTTDALKGHTIPHIDGINVAVGSPTEPVYVSEGGQVRPCTYAIAVGYSSANNTICFY